MKLIDEMNNEKNQCLYTGKRHSLMMHKCHPILNQIIYLMFEGFVGIGQ